MDSFGLRDVKNAVQRQKADACILCRCQGFSEKRGPGTVKFNFDAVKARVKRQGGRPFTYADLSALSKVPPTTISRIDRGMPTTSASLDRLLAAMFRLMRPLEPDMTDDELCRFLLGEFIQPDLEADRAPVRPDVRGGYKPGKSRKVE
jgi:hypothetical protein